VGKYRRERTIQDLRPTQMWARARARRDMRALSQRAIAAAGCHPDTSARRPMRGEGANPVAAHEGAAPRLPTSELRLSSRELPEPDRCDYGARAMQPRACGFSVGVPPAVRHRLLTPAPLRVASVGFLQSLHEVDDWSCPGSVDGDGLSDQAAGRCFFSWLIGDS
jgi:hypothetical protein